MKTTLMGTSLILMAFLNGCATTNPGNTASSSSRTARDMSREESKTNTQNTSRKATTDRTHPN